MPLKHSASFLISESSQVGAARRAAVTLTASLDFNETRQGEIALIVTEAATNILKHAVHGELMLRVLETADPSPVMGIEVLAMDNGPGMASIHRSLEDGYSTAGTYGSGLGAISRLSDALDIYSYPGMGTVLRSELWSSGVKRPPELRGQEDFPTREYGVVSRPKPGQEVCGDSWAVAHLPGKSLFMVADGLGHGLEASLASLEAVRQFHGATQTGQWQGPKEVIEAMNRSMGATRGAAVAIAEVSVERGEVRFVGIGNIAGTVIMPDLTHHTQHNYHAHHMVSHNGIVGHQMKKVQEFIYPWSENGLLIFHSDGLSNKWRLDSYPGLRMGIPSLIAGVLYRDFQRPTDDATVLVASVSETDKLPRI